MNDTERAELLPTIETRLADAERRQELVRLEIARLESQLRILTDPSLADWQRRTGHENGRKAGR